jgi:hypothetical protein
MVRTRFLILSQLVVQLEILIYRHIPYLRKISEYPLYRSLTDSWHSFSAVYPFKWASAATFGAFTPNLTLP